jgi:DNA invertase Pin-like site-specific DNA recombinase
MVIAYLRVSTDEQAQSGLGLEAQLAAIEKAIGKPDATFTDEGYSGSDSNRPALLDALDALKRGDTLAIAKRDRLARDLYLAAWIEKEAKRRGARIVSAAGEGTENDDPASVLMRQIVDAFAEYERAMIGARTKAALAAKKARGEKTGGDVPFGYVLGDNGTLSTDRDEQEALEIIAELRRRGYTLRGICAELEKRGIKTKRGKAKWQSRVISRIVKHAA